MEGKAKKKCFAAVTREFWNGSVSDGTETEFFYEDNPLGTKLRECNTVAEAKEILGVQNPGPYTKIEVIAVETYKGKLP